MLQKFRKLDKKKKLMILLGALALVFILTASSVGAIYLITREKGEARDSSGEGGSDESITDIDEEGRQQDVSDGTGNDGDDTDPNEDEEDDDNDGEEGADDTDSSEEAITVNEDGQTDPDGDDTSGDEGSDTGDSQSETQPQFTEVIETMENIDSYKLDATTVYDQVSIEAYYSSPDRERIIETDGEIVSEEIKVGNNYYARTEDGAWESIPEPILTNFHDEFFTEILNMDAVLDLDGEKNGDWVYSMNMDGMLMEVFVEKETNYIRKVTGSAEGITGIVMTFSKYGEDFSITAPI